MKKSLFASAIMAAAIIPAFVIPAQAEELIPNGEYEVNFLTYKTGTTETSGMANRFAQPAKLIAKDGAYALQIQIITQNQLLSSLSIPYKGSTAVMKTIEGDLTTATRIIELPIDTFNKAVTVSVDVVFPGSLTPVTQTFDLIVDAPADEKLTEQVQLTAYKFNTIEKSSMQNYIVPTVKLVYDQKKTYAQITFTNKALINGFSLNGVEATIEATNGDAVTYEVEVQNPKQLQHAKISVNAGGTVMQQDAHLHFAVKGAPVMLANPFTDLQETAATSAILNLVNKSILKADTTFNPTKNATREQFALMLARTLKLTSTEQPTYTDVQNLSAESKSAIAALHQAQIIKSATKFNPKTPITREQAALMIYRSMQYHVGTAALDFGNNISVYADATSIRTEESARALSFLYVSNAYVGEKVDNQQYSHAKKAITRAEIATLLNNTLKYLGH
jgi:heme-binding NEAT domain protein